MLFKWNDFFVVFGLLVLGITVSSCDPDPIPDQPDPTTYGAGLYICNEGPFMSGTGTITYYDDLAAAADQAIFQAANDNQSLGSILQSLTFDVSSVYAIVNNANEVVVLNKETFEIKERITDFELPRYMLILGDKGYISQWGSDGVSGKVIVLNLTNNSTLKEIETGQGTERMLFSNDQIYVVNEGGFGRDSTLIIIDPNTDEIINEVSVGDNPTSIQADQSGTIWTLGKGYTANFYDPNDPANTAGQLCNVQADGSILSCLDVPNGSTDLVISDDGNWLYFATGTQIQRFATDGSMSIPAVFYEGYFYDLYWDAANKELLASDPGDFTTLGQVIRIDASGNLLGSIETGIIPSFITRK